VRNRPGRDPVRCGCDRGRRPSERCYVRRGGGTEAGFRDNGRVTAGTCCGLNDGAAALVIMSDGKAAAFGIATLGSYRVDRCQCVVAGNHGPGPGCGRTRQALARAGMTIGDMDLVEMNEAFAAQVIPSYRELGIDIAHLNVNGGAIAVGHPFGMTGARIGATLIRSLQFHNKQFGPETMCVGGGQGMALILGRMS
jgi:acetyl-CoA C-acetyltransferase